ncbi:hypothetical protein KEM48_008174 [Puccinia striiformis f. sp. tritici PST-130]|nr:hypothetical protein KEM48_008174 [Puccinia striiformis f. sp. tritici PST-130]
MKDEGCLPPFCRFNSAALGQTHQKIHEYKPKTDLDSLIEPLLDLHTTWDILYDRIETVAWEPPSDITQDHHYGHSKFFRTDLLAHDH